MNYLQRLRLSSEIRGIETSLKTPVQAVGGFFVLRSLVFREHYWDVVHDSVRWIRRKLEQERDEAPGRNGKPYGDVLRELASIRRANDMHTLFEVMAFHNYLLCGVLARSRLKNDETLMVQCSRLLIERCAQMGTPEHLMDMVSARIYEYQEFGRHRAADVGFGEEFFTGQNSPLFHHLADARKGILGPSLDGSLVLHDDLGNLNNAFNVMGHACRATLFTHFVVPFCETIDRLASGSADYRQMDAATAWQILCLGQPPGQPRPR